MSVELFHHSSLAITGERFSPTIFDERALFSGEPEPDSTLQYGPEKMAEFSYRGKAQLFSCNGERVDLRSSGSDDFDIFPADLIDSARQVINSIEAVRKAVRLKYVTWGCSFVFPPVGNAMLGKDLCLGLAQETRLNDLFGMVPDFFSAHMRAELDNQSFEIVVEPHFETKGRSLFLAVNGTQSVFDPEPLVDKMKGFITVKEKSLAYAQQLHTEMSGAALS